MGVPLYDYSKWPNFSKEELVCSHTHLENPHIKKFERLMCLVQALRSWHCVPFTVTSAYRHITHPSEAKKLHPGQHTIAAIDIQVPPEIAHLVVAQAFEAGCTGIGIKMHGPYNERFIHLDFREGPARVWSYP